MEFCFGAFGRVTLVAVSLIVSSAVAVPAATLLGDVTVTYDFTNGFRTNTVTVGAGPEITCPGPSQICEVGLVGSTTLDFGIDTITFTQSSSGATT